MSTASQLAANTKNAQLSTGPRTESGKAVSSQNGVSHGLTSSEFRLLPHEDASEFETLTLRLYEEFDPQGDHETFLVDLMAQSRWKIARADRLENAAFMAMIDGSAQGPDGRIVEAMSKNGRDPLATLQRYSAAAERAYTRAHRELLQTRKSTLKLQIDQANAFLTGILGAPRPSLRRPPEKNGFASQQQPTSKAGAGPDAAPGFSEPRP